MRPRRTIQILASECRAAFVIASVAGTIGIVPGGLGTFEAACVGMLHAVGVHASGARCPV